MKQQTGRLVIIGLLISGVLAAAFLIGGQNEPLPPVSRLPQTTVSSPSGEESVVRQEQSRYTSEPSVPEPPASAPVSVPAVSAESTDSISEVPSGAASEPSVVESSAVAKAEEVLPASSAEPAVSSSAVMVSEEPSVEESSEEETSAVIPAAHTCLLSVRCDNALGSPLLKPEVRELLPADGVIFDSLSVSYQPGESAFDVLRRECQTRHLHLDFSKIPLTGGVYVKGICNLYEFDCGSLSGWMISVNGEFLKSSCSEYYLSDGDKVLFVYTCDLGKDVGNEYTGD